MKRTNKQIVRFIKSTFNKYEQDDCSFQDSIFNYWMRYELNDSQTKFLDETKNKLSGWSSIDGIYLDCGFPSITKGLK